MKKKEQQTILSAKVFLGWRKFLLFVIGAILFYFDKLSSDVFTYLSMLVITAYAVGERIGRPQKEWMKLLYSKTLVGLRSLTVAIVGTFFLWIEKLDSLQWLMIAGTFLLGNSFEWAIGKIKEKVEDA